MSSAPAIPADVPAVVGTRQIDRIQVGRGLACIGLVLFHVVGGRPADGLHVADDTLLRALIDDMMYVLMPFYAFLSGYVYALKPVDIDRPWGFLANKLRRLALPALSASTLFFLFAWLRAPIPPLQVPAALLHAWFFSYEIYWFLQAILLIFFALPLLERFLLRWPAGLAVAVLATFFLTIPAEPIDLMSLDGAMFLAPFFFVGIAAKRFFTIGGLWTGLLLAVLAGCLAIHTIEVMTHVEHIGSDRGTWLSLLIASSASLLIVGYIPRSALLARLGAASFAIYLFHIFFVVPTRLVLLRVGIADLGVQILVGIVAGIAGPMLLEQLILRSAVARRLLLGLN